jgi:hypothetical protein
MFHCDDAACFECFASRFASRLAPGVAGCTGAWRNFPRPSRGRYSMDADGGGRGDGGEASEGRGGKG